MRRAALLLALAGLWAPQAIGQSSTFTSALPPSDAALDRARLKTEWAIHVPIEGRTDSVTHMQIVDSDQAFVQTRSGLVLVLDSRTGQRMWSYKFPTGRATTYPVSTNSRYVFISNLSTIYCFHRFTGLLEFKFEPTIRLGVPLQTITSGPVCDDEFVYFVVGNQDLLAYRLPNPVRQPDPAASKEALALAKKSPKVANPADVVAERYPGKGLPSQQTDPEQPSRGFPSSEINVNTKQLSPSISVMPSVTPPYQFRDRNGQDILRAESLTPLNSMRHPYRIHDGDGRYIVKSPSVTVIPPSVHRVQELNDIRPKGLEPIRLWRYEATNRIAFEPVLAGARLWLTFQSPRALALDRLDQAKEERIVQTNGILSSPASSAMKADQNTGYLAMSDGSLIAIDLLHGGRDNRGALKQLWRANVGGMMNRKVVVSQKAIFVGGSESGIARIDRATGTLDWRSDADDDFLLTINEDSIYTRNSNGTVRVYDQKSPVDPITKTAVAVAEIALPGFTVPVSNSFNDRLILASDNGLVICLRDSSPKFLTPQLTLPKPVAKPADKKDDKKPETAPMGN